MFPISVHPATKEPEYVRYVTEQEGLNATPVMVKADSSTHIILPVFRAVPKPITPTLPVYDATEKRKSNVTSVTARDGINL
jgi:hypothetical protein